MQYNEKFHGNKWWKSHNRKAIRDRKKAGEELSAIFAVFLLPFALPIMIIGKIFGLFKRK